VLVEDGPWLSSDISASDELELARGLWRVEDSAPDSSGSGAWSVWICF
jgi:hypothetical protein